MTDFGIGDIWKEVDPRFERYVRVVAWNDDYVRIRSCTADGRFLNRRHGPASRKAKLARFNGKHGGYAIYSRSAT